MMTPVSLSSCEGKINECTESAKHRAECLENIVYDSEVYGSYDYHPFL